VVSRKKLIVASANHWHSPFQVGSHHLARGFVNAGWDVAFVSDPLSPWHVLGGNYTRLQERYRLYADGGHWDLDDHLWAYVPAAALTPHNKPILNSRWVARYWSRAAWPRIGSVLRQAGFGSVDLVYCDSVVPFSWLQKVPHRKSLYRIADQYAAFGKFSAAMVELEKDVAQWVDAVVYASHSLEEHAKSLRPRNLAHLPNGVNFDHFSLERTEIPKEYGSIPKPIATYVGAMDVWFDWDLVNFAVERLPDVSFVLIGPDERARRVLKPARNLFLLGSRPYQELPIYLQHADVGLIPFDVAHYENLVRSIHPLKLYEYLASGLPVVSVEWDELRWLKSPARLTHNHDEFVEGIRQSLATPPDKTSLKRYAADKDWSLIVRQLIEIVDCS
jgi:glycosyltransferase involved in cell wall biosynthesis